MNQNQRLNEMLIQLMERQQQMAISSTSVSSTNNCYGILTGHIGKVILRPKTFIEELRAEIRDWHGELNVIWK